MLTGMKYESINERGLTVTNSEGIETTLEADNIIPVAPLVADTGLADSFKRKALEVYAIASDYHTARSILRLSVRFPPN